MTFRTKLDYSDNRQIKQRERTSTILSGTTVFGVPFSALTSGPDMGLTAQTSQYFSVISSYSGNSATTVFTWSIPNVSAIDSSISALTPTNSGVSQNINAVFGSSSTTIIDGNLVNLTYSGVGATNLYPITMSELTPGNYTGTISTDFFIYSAQTLDFTGRTIWIDNTEILRTKKLIVSDNPQPGYVLTSNSEGLATWQSVSAVTSGTTFWSASTGNFAIVTENSGNLASGDYSLAEGYQTTAIGDYSHAEGENTTASGDSSHTEGLYTSALGNSSHAEGYDTTAIGNYSHVEGWQTTTINDGAHSEGYGTTASGDYSHAEGEGAKAIGNVSHAEGFLTTSNGAYSHSEGYQTISQGQTSHAEGYLTKASGDGSHAEGGSLISLISGGTASGNGSHAEGYNTLASGQASHAEGVLTSATTVYAHAEGQNTLASGTASHAEGYKTTASGVYSHTEGYDTTASGVYSHAEGYQTVASGQTSHASGQGTKAIGNISFVHGVNSVALANYTVVLGRAITGTTSDTTYTTNLNIDKQDGAFASKLGINTSAPAYPLDVRGSSLSRFYYSTALNGSVVVSATTGLPMLWAGTNSGVVNENGSISMGMRGWDDITYTAYGKPGDTHLYSSKQSNGLNIISSDGTGTEDYIRFYVGGDAVGGTLAMHMQGSGATTGFVGVNTSIPTERFDVDGNGRFRSIGSSASAGALHYASDGTLTTNTSDRRLKTNIQTLTGALDKVNQLRGVTYNWVENANGDSRIGFIAQEVNTIVPELTFINPNSSESYMGVHYDNVTALLVEAVKELSSGITTSNNTHLETQTILAEDNNIELNYNGNKTSAIGGGISIINGLGDGINADFKLNNDGSWVTNNPLSPSSLIIPEYTPSNSYDNYGKNGDVTKDENYLYIKSINKWKRVRLEEF